MSLPQTSLVSFVSLLVLLNAHGVERFVSPSGGHVAPFNDWLTAATNIQAAIDTATSGDIVTVTNGIYDTGGKVKAGDLTNRIAIDKPITVQSVNGPQVTIIQGAWDLVATNGPGAVRCAWLTNGATLSGFTLRGGATRGSSGSLPPDISATNSGGGLWSTSVKSIATNCIISGNAAAVRGGGVFSNTVLNSIISGNIVISSSQVPLGGGTYGATLKNCAVISNRITSASAGVGGGAAGGALTNCSVVGNFARSAGGVTSDGATVPVMNCIVVSNSVSSSQTNYSGTVVFGYSCTTPLPAGTGNIATNAQLILDNYHIAYTSPCRGTGRAAAVTGTDIDGQPWNSPPSMGCDENAGEPFFITQPRIAPGPLGQLQFLGAAVTGLNPISFSWLKDGNILSGSRYGGLGTSQLFINGLGPQDAGSYQIVASNAVGMATSAVAQVTVRCVNVAGVSPTEPYADWPAAATNIQTAIDLAAIGDVLLVTNGVYDVGGKVMSGDLTNRIAVDKALIVMSANGAANTFIVGTPGRGGVNSGTAPNGTNAVRCAWLADGAILSGFTLQGGGTRSSIGTSESATNSGGGVWCASQSAMVSYCLIQENSAYFQGGGGYGGTFANCTIMANGAGMTAPFQFRSSSQGGGVYNCNLNNCLVRGNQSGGDGGGAYGGALINCTVINNYTESLSGAGAGAKNSVIRNSILWNNAARGIRDDISGNGITQYSCSGKVVSGTGNITNNPLFLADGFHLSSASPCRGAGNTAYANGTDLDGQTWTNPPAMGCDEWLPQPVLLSFRLQANSWGQFDFVSQVAGIESSPGYWFKDGSLLTGSSHFLGADSTHLTVKGLSAADTGDYQLVVSNAFGMTTSRVASVALHFVNAGNPAATAPYTNWVTAAGNIQDAIDAASADAVILVTNGIYNTGGKLTDVFDVTNRIALDKPVTVVSVNGPFQTAVEGQWDPVSTNGVNAVRCALLSSNSSLAGFTLRNGATRDNSRLGGGVAAYYDEMVASCIISNNRAGGGGGALLGSYYNCWFINNSALSFGGGVYLGSLNNCTVVQNSAGTVSGGVFGSSITNCIVWYNSAPSSPDVSAANIYNSCSPLIGISSGSITNNPQLVDGLHLAANSPCRGVGSVNLFSATDLDGDAWSSPPSMGADEFPAAGAVGPLTVAIESLWTAVVANHPLILIGRITGNTASLEWNYGDGPVVTNASYFTTHTWTNPGDYLVTLTAFNADNLPGVSTNVLIHVEPLLSPELAPSLSASGTNFQIQFPGQAGINYGLEYATNLAAPTTWLTLKTLTSTGGVVQFTDPAATNAARFYRVKAQ
ncbi:MAG: PKD domain-containing protein [Verrucomicrobiota bacterium]